ncbi:MAG: rhomboid family intramembrane serine protease [Proteobacteria bacterium]|jgi:membrane associated rhomboid family serine protease|nr:rhomboid family intramembrane serine protease [Pseudomonadota bacterium]MBK7115670.1 rhomboid family intramembrane serine protease [Pseudomonadota bacterium]MBK9250672.1 rhomboid family intramembrane serine protease [Pseudomonadota bacterium]
MNGIGPASLFILVSNIGLSLAGLFLAPQIIERCLFRPVEFARGLRRATLVTSGFVHADLPHLLFNMLTFWFFGPPLERRIGTPMFVLLYAAGLLVSQYGSYRKQRHNPQYATLGASGAISAVLFANIVYWPTNTLILMFLPIPIPAPLFGIAYLAYTWWSARQSRDRINHDAHLGGALAGLAFVALFDPQAYVRAWALVAG